MKLFIVVNLDTFFLSHRQAIAVSAVQHCYEVTIVAKDTGSADKIKALGLNFIDLPISKAGLNIISELKTLSFLSKLFRNKKPDIVHLVGMKTILWGGLAARIHKVPNVVSAVCGVGVLFSPEYNVGLRRIISSGVIAVMRYIHKGNNVHCIFHNTDDQEMFVNKGIIALDRCVRTMGSGIDLMDYSYSPEPVEGTIKILFTARMVEEKGVLVLIDAANKLKEQYYNKIQFLLCGSLDTNPLAVTREVLTRLCDGEYIVWLGRRDDVKEQLTQCHIFAFPSYYKEGLPKSCIEAAAIGRPIITCDSTGCRDTVIDGKTGYLIPIKDSESLAEKLKMLIDNTEMRRNMGKQSRIYAESAFSIQDVIDVHLKIYNTSRIAE